MDQQLTVPTWALVAALLGVLLLAATLLLVVRRSRRRATREREAARAEAASLRSRLDDLERRLAAPSAAAAVRDERDYVITRVGDRPLATAGAGRGDEEPAPVVAAPLFADLVLREGVVQAVSLAAGLRRALAPETRNRIRFEMRREVKRARKQRRSDLRDARRDWEARQRGATLDEGTAA